MEVISSLVTQMSEEVEKDREIRKYTHQMPSLLKALYLSFHDIASR